MRSFITPRTVVLIAMGLVVAAVIVIARGGDDTYDVKLRLANAAGLRDGSPVVIGGVRVGKVSLDANHDAVDVDLHIDRKYAPIGRDASAELIAQNAIGQKRVSIDIGDATNPAPEGFLLPDSRVREATDLDQLLSTLDPDTRARLAILANELGTAFAGRELDFKQFLIEAPRGLASGARVLEQLGRDNRALENLLTTSDRYVADLARERRRISAMLDTIGRTTQTVSARRADLRETLRNAPGALASTRSFLAELRRTTQPLASTSRLLSRTAPSVSTLLERIEPFRRSAKPVLDVLGDKIAPAIRKLNPSGETYYRARRSLDLLRAASEDEIPRIGDTLELSTDNLLATMENWSRAIQFRDKMGHVFRGEGSFTPDFYDSLLGRLTGVVQNKSKARSRRPKAESRPETRPAPSQERKADPRPKVPERLRELTKRLEDGLKQLPGRVERLPEQLPEDVRKLLGGLSGPGVRTGDDDMTPLLDFLLR